MSVRIILLSFIVILAGCSGTGNPEIVEGRSVVASKGLVVSAHPESSAIGAAVLKKGGNAIDAAVATEFALSVCYPEAGNLGGGGFMLIRNADGSAGVIDYREKAPMRAGRDMFLDASGAVVEGASTDTRLASGVPGTVDGMLRAHSLYGRLPFGEVIQPAIDLAENGFSLPAWQARSLNSYRDQFLAKNGNTTAFVRDSLWKEGDILLQKDLAATLRRIRDRGREGFYAGETASLIIKEMSNGNGLINSEDLAAYKSVARIPLAADYHGYTIITAAPPSGGGITLLQMLGMVEPFNLKNLGFHTAASIHLITEAERRAFADRAEYSGDPDFVKVPVSGLLSKEYLHERMHDFNPEKATPSAAVSHGMPPAGESSETTHYSVVDSEGNAVAATTTLNGTFGSGIVVKGAGFLLNNQMDDFSVKPGFPNMYGLVGGEANAIAPGKRMLSSMTPVIVEKDKRLFMVAGSPGGSTIPTSVFQVLTNVIDYGMTIAEAVDTGRFHHQWLPDYISIEKNSVDSLTLHRLKSMGHTFKERSAIGRVNAILVSPDGKRYAGADRRGDNRACGY